MKLLELLNVLCRMTLQQWQEASAYDIMRFGEGRPGYHLLARARHLPEL